MAQYVWNPSTANILDPQNAEAAGGILRNVRLSKLYRQISQLEPDSLDYQALQQNPTAWRGTSYNLSGLCVSAATWTEPLAEKYFLPDDGTYTLCLVECAWQPEEELSETFFVVFPIPAHDAEQYIPQAEEGYSCSATLIGTITLNETESLLFMHN